MIELNNLSADLGTKYEDTEKVSRIMAGDWEASIIFEPWFREVYQNFRRMAGHIYSEADLEKLNLEKRPAFVYNLLLPIILRLTGSFITNQSKVEAQPRTQGDILISRVLSDVLDYVHYEENNLDWEYVISYVNALIGRVGWTCMDWSYRQNPDGMLEIQADDPFSIKWVGDIKRRNLLDVNLLIKNVWCSPEEMIMTYATEDDDMAEAIMEKAKLFIGSDPKRRQKILSYIERTFGYALQYGGKDTGFDALDFAAQNFIYRDRTAYYDSYRGIFKILEVHERHFKKIWTIYDPIRNKELNITKAVKADEENINRYDPNLMAYIRERFTYNGRVEPIIKKKPISEMRQLAVCPAFNFVLYDEPYAVQNNFYKYTPNFCFDFGNDPLEWKSYVDHMIDAVASFNLDQNTLQSYMMAAAAGETWAEEDALLEHEEAFRQKKVNALKIVKKGALQRKKIVRQMPSPLPASYAQSSMFRQQLVKDVTGVHDNAMGTQETSGESGKLFDSRVAQSDQLEVLAKHNAVNQLKVIGTNSKDYCAKYLGPGRVMRITMDETNPFWLEINGDFIRRIFYDPQNGNQLGVEEIPGTMSDAKVDIVISKVPFGESAKKQEFQETVMLNSVVSQMNPMYGSAKLVAKAATLRNKNEWLTHIEMVDGQMDMYEKMMALQGSQQILQQKSIGDQQKVPAQIPEQAGGNGENKMGKLINNQVMNHIIGQAI